MKTLLLSVITFAVIIIFCHPLQGKSAYLFPLKSKDKFGYIDRTGNFVIAPRFDEARRFSEDLAAVKIGERWGYIDDSGKIIVRPQFEYAGNFREGMGRIKLGGFGFINRAGDIVIKHELTRAHDFHEGLAFAETCCGKWAFIDKAGVPVINLECDAVEDFSDGFAAVACEKIGFINKQGKLAIENPKFIEVDSFSEGLAGVRFDNEMVGFIDQTGKVVIPPLFENAERFNEGLALVKVNERYGFINKAGEMVVAPDLYYAGAFSEGLALFHAKPPDEDYSWRNLKWGFIDRSGKVVIEPAFNSISPFSDGVALVGNTDNLFYIDKAGRTLSVTDPSSSRQPAKAMRRDKSH